MASQQNRPLPFPCIFSDLTIRLSAAKTAPGRVQKVPEVASRPPWRHWRPGTAPRPGGRLTDEPPGAPDPRRPPLPAACTCAPSSRRRGPTPGPRAHRPAPRRKRRDPRQARVRGRGWGGSARRHMQARNRPIGCGRASRGARRLRLVPELQRLPGPGVHVTLCLIPPVTESCAAAAPVAAAAAARGAPAPPPRFEVAAAGGAAGSGSRAPRAPPPRRVPEPPPPAAGDAAASRLRLSRGSAAELPGPPPRWVRASPGPGLRGWEPRRRRGPAARRRGPSRGCGWDLAAQGAGGPGARRARAASGTRPGARLGASGPADRSAFGNLRGGGRRAGPARGRCLRAPPPAPPLPARAPPSLASLRPIGRAGRPG